MNSKLNIAFFGTPELCIPILEKLKEDGYALSVIITAPDRPVGRKYTMTPPPVKVWAENAGIPILQPEKINDEFKEKILKYKINLSLVVAYGQIMPRWLIDLPEYGTLNLHYSLLPKYRGASPVEGAILAGENITGVCIQKMKYELDAGGVIACQEVSIEAHDTALMLRNKLNEIGINLISQTIPKWISGELRPIEQDEDKATYTKKISKEDGEVDIEKMSGEELYLRYRAYWGWPGIFFFDANNRRVKITDAVYEDGKFVIKKIIPEGKKEKDFKIF